MKLLLLFWEFFKIGLFSVGGGMATVPFLYDLAEKTGWYTQAQILDMLAVSESTPGPMGVNMATYVGFHKEGIPGAVVATLGLIFPSIIVIIIIAGFLQKFDTVLEPVVFRKYDTTDTCLYNQLGTFDTRRGRHV